MKRVISILLALFTLFSLTGCCLCIPDDTSDNRTTIYQKDPTWTATIPTTTPEIAPATEPTEESTLEATIEPTTEPTEEPTTQPTTAPTTAPPTEPTVSFAELSQYYHHYSGSWCSTEAYHYIDAWLEQGIYYLRYTSASGNAAHIAEALASIEIVDIENYQGIFYLDDSHGNKYILKLDFSQPETITGTIIITEQNLNAIWSITPGTYTFVPNNDI